MKRGKLACALAVLAALGAVFFWKMVLPIFEAGGFIESDWEGQLPASWIQGD